jgi:SWI/SNF-related matrix-associated actin-dependent regulator of chromatin subfamily A member 5
MVPLHHNGLNGILADEMVRNLAPRLVLLITNILQGLGTTLQTISFIAYLKHHLSIPSPHLIVVTKFTLQNFESWTPDVQIVVLTGTKEERAEIITTRLIPQDFEICITSYEICLIEKSTSNKICFKYIIIESKTSIPFCRRSFDRSQHISA